MIADYIIPGKTVSEANCRDHWRTKHKRSSRARFFGKALTPAGVTLPCHVELTRYGSGSRALDDDNLRGALKAIRDGIAERIGVDDGDIMRITFGYAQAKCKRGEEHTRVVIRCGKDHPSRTGRNAPA